MMVAFRFVGKRTEPPVDPLALVVAQLNTELETERRLSQKRLVMIDRQHLEIEQLSAQVARLAAVARDHERCLPRIDRPFRLADNVVR